MSRSLFVRRIVTKTRRKKQVAARRRVPRNISMKTHSFIQAYRPSAGSLVVTGGVGGLGYNAATGLLFSPDGSATYANGFFSLKFSLADIPQVATYQSLFDAYMIEKCIFELQPIQGNITSAIDVGTAGESVSPLVITVLDYDDFGLLTTLGSIEEYQTYKQTSAAVKHRRTIVPALSINAFKSSGLGVGFL